jgi:hypothetical protein
MVRQVFLSYARADDEVPREAREAIGWVRYFHDHVVAGLLGRGFKDINFWRDVDEYSDNEEFERKIAEALQDAVLFVAIVSPNFLDTQWCLKELDLFVRHLEKRTAEINRERIIKVLKHWVEENHLPEPLQGRVGFRFFGYSDKKGVRPFFDFGRLRDEQQYLLVMEEIVNYLEKILRSSTLNRTADSPAGIDIQARKRPLAINTPSLELSEPATTLWKTDVVFIAKTSRDRQEVYLRLAAELERRGSRVLPDKATPLPDSLEEAVPVIQTALADAALSIHLIGETGGITLDGADDPIVNMQLSMAAQRAREDCAFQRLIWIPPDLRELKPAQQELVATLRRGEHLLEGDDLIEEPFELFKQQVIRRLTPLANVSPRLAPPRLYIMCADNERSAAASSVRRLLFEAGIEPMLPLTTGTTQEQRHHEVAELRACDAVLIYLGEVSEYWLWGALRKIHDWQALGRDRPFVNRSLLLAPPTAEAKKEILTHDIDLLLDGQAGIDGDTLAPLVTALFGSG